jgi:hypothetical protein
LKNIFLPRTKSILWKETYKLAGRKEKNLPGLVDGKNRSAAPEGFPSLISISGKPEMRPTQFYYDFRQRFSMNIDPN